MFVAEPPQEGLPHGRWEESLAERFRDACVALPDSEDFGEIGDIAWFPDRTWGGRTYIPAAAATSNDFEVFGWVSFRPGSGEDGPSGFRVHADWTQETADQNPDWQLDLSDGEIGHWRGQRGLSGDVALVWGIALVANGAVATAELGPTTTDQCELVEERFTLVSLDSFTGDYLEVKLWGAGGGELASESLYEEE
jgi:hypothetical protein